jgi:AraC family transcriptional regulator
MKQPTETLEISRYSPITLGEKLKSLEIDGFVFTETAHKPNQTLPRHYHEHANIAFVLKGSFTEVLDRRIFECGRQSIIIKPSGEAHANHYGQRGMHCLLIEVQPQRLESLHPLSKTLNQISHFQGGMLSMLAMRIYKEMRITDSASHLAMEGLALELIAELSRHSNITRGLILPRWLKLSREILNAHFTETIRLADVAEKVDVHPVHLAREFRRFYGCSLGEYTRGLRIETACRKLFIYRYVID